MTSHRSYLDSTVTSTAPYMSHSSLNLPYMAQQSSASGHYASQPPSAATISYLPQPYATTTPYVSQSSPGSPASSAPMTCSSSSAQTSCSPSSPPPTRSTRATGRGHAVSSAHCPEARPDEDWTHEPDLATRRRLQNRIAQRNYRRRQRIARGLDSPSADRQSPQRAPRRSRRAAAETQGDVRHSSPHQRSPSNSSSDYTLEYTSTAHGDNCKPYNAQYSGHPQVAVSQQYGMTGFVPPSSQTYLSQGTPYSQSSAVFSTAPNSPLPPMVASLSTSPSSRMSTSPSPSYNHYMHSVSSSANEYGSSEPYASSYLAVPGHGYGSVPELSYDTDPSQIPRQAPGYYRPS